MQAGGGAPRRASRRLGRALARPASAPRPEAGAARWAAAAPPPFCARGRARRAQAAAVPRAPPRAFCRAARCGLGGGGGPPAPLPSRSLFGPTPARHGKAGAAVRPARGAILCAPLRGLSCTATGPCRGCTPLEPQRAVHVIPTPTAAPCLIGKRPAPTAGGAPGRRAPSGRRRRRCARYSSAVRPPTQALAERRTPLQNPATPRAPRHPGCAAAARARARARSKWRRMPRLRRASPAPHGPHRQPLAAPGASDGSGGGAPLPAHAAHTACRAGARAGTHARGQAGRPAGRPVTPCCARCTHMHEAQATKGTHAVPATRHPQPGNFGYFSPE